MTSDSFQSLNAWFQDLSAEIHRSGTPAEITAGLACVHHRLALNTKDCDIWIPPASLQVFKNIAANRTWQNTHAIYRSRLSAPLDARWLDGGWSSHITWPGPPQAQMDIFGRLPRVTHHTDSGTFSNEQTLARVKMTQREKDWPTVHLLGVRLLAKNNPEGLLFLQTAESLLEARQQIDNETWNTQTIIRPLLARLSHDPGADLLDASLRIEKFFWQQVDHLRIQRYQEAIKDYAKASEKILQTHPQFAAQDAALIRLAESTLPQRPLQDVAEKIVESAEAHALAAVDLSKFDARWLPLAWAKATLETCYAPPPIAIDIPPPVGR